eukprot:Rhum_TRINITY_DN15378_c10_g1::Rhum_TRINITY_DN15378_c10_g1_i1::g.154380::m.154380
MCCVYAVASSLFVLRVRVVVTNEALALSKLLQRVADALSGGVRVVGPPLGDGQDELHLVHSGLHPFLLLFEEHQQLLNQVLVLVVRGILPTLVRLCVDQLLCDNAAHHLRQRHVRQLLDALELLVAAEQEVRHRQTHLLRRRDRRTAQSARVGKAQQRSRLAGEAGGRDGAKQRRERVDVVLGDDGALGDDVVAEVRQLRAALLDPRLHHLEEVVPDGRAVLDGALLEQLLGGALQEVGRTPRKHPNLRQRRRNRLARHLVLVLLRRRDDQLHDVLTQLVRSQRVLHGRGQRLRVLAAVVQLLHVVLRVRHGVPLHGRRRRRRRRARALAAPHALRLRRRRSRRGRLHVRDGLVRRHDAGGVAAVRARVSDVLPVALLLEGG